MDQAPNVSEGFDEASRRAKDIARWGPVLGDPCPMRRLLKEPVLGGAVKVRDEDFLVEEIPLYEPSGEGEHLYISVQKSGMSHSEMLDIIKRHYAVPESAIGSAGMKDRVAVTRQTLSIHLPGQSPPSDSIRDGRLQIQWASRHTNKLRRGHLKGNRFVIRIRDLDPLLAPKVWRGLKELERRGVPNYYGLQRFGYRRNTQRLGALLLRQSHEELINEILGAQGSWYPPHQEQQRQAFDEGRLSDALPFWGPRDIAERIVLSRLVSGAPSKIAVKSISRHMRIFWASAVQSAVFNHMLEARIRDNTIDRILEGDMAYRHQSRNAFLVDKGTMGAEDQQARADAFEISPSGPIIGTGTTCAQGDIGRVEEAIIASTGITEECYVNAGFDLKGTRRPYRVPVSNLDLESGFDDHGPYIRVAFDLPRGAYATVVLQEILGEEAVDSARTKSREDPARDASDDIR